MKVKLIDCFFYTFFLLETEDEYGVKTYMPWTPDRRCRMLFESKLLSEYEVKMKEDKLKKEDELKKEEELKKENRKKKNVQSTLLPATLEFVCSFTSSRNGVCP